MTNLVEVTIPQPADTADQDARALVEQARGFTVATVEDFKVGADALRTIKARWKAVEEQRKELVRPLDEAKKRIQRFFAVPLGFLEEAEDVIKRKLTAFETEQERLRIEAQRAADAAAKAERERLEREAREAEAKARAKAEEERRAAEEAAAAGKADEAAKLAAKAARTEARGEERAAALVAKADHVVAEVVEVERPKAAGVSTVERWSFEIVDREKLPRAYMVEDEKKIRRVVEAMKRDTDIPGVRVFPVKTMAARARG